LLGYDEIESLGWHVSAHGAFPFEVHAGFGASIAIDVLAGQLSWANHYEHAHGAFRSDIQVYALHLFDLFFLRSLTLTAHLILLR